MHRRIVATLNTDTGIDDAGVMDGLTAFKEKFVGRRPNRIELSDHTWRMLFKNIPTIAIDITKFYGMDIVFDETIPDYTVRFVWEGS